MKTRGFAIPPEAFMAVNGEPSQDHATQVRIFPSGATRDTDQCKPDYEGFLSPLVLRRFGQYMTKHRKQSDGSLRNSDNWQRGIPRRQYVKSLFRHFMDVWLWNRKYPEAMVGEIEEALCGVIFNACGLLHEILIGRDVQDG